MSTYTITVSALGYETTKTEVRCEDMAAAKRFIGKAKRQWVDANAVEYSTAGLASVTIERGAK